MSKSLTTSIVEPERILKPNLFNILSFYAKTLSTSEFLSRDDIDGVTREAGLQKIHEKGASWVVCSGDHFDRLVGAQYLAKKLQEQTHLNFKWSVAPTKYCITMNGGAPQVNFILSNKTDILSLSQYAGSIKPSDMNLSFQTDKGVITKKTGFRDFLCASNLRKQADGSIVIFDTEKSSFAGIPEVEDAFSIPRVNLKQKHEFSGEQILITAALYETFQTSSSDISTEVVGHIASYLYEDLLS